MSDQPTPATTPAPRRRRRWLLVTTVALAAALTGAVASQAISQHRGGWHGHGFMGGAFDPARAEERADRAIRHLAIEIDATNAQEDKLRAIAKAAVKDLIPLREKAVSARQKAHGLLTQTTIDKAAIEAFRTEHMALAEAASKRFTQAIGEMADVLTFEQRRKIDERIGEFRERRGYWRPWHRG
jgi:Spy/CpxP family protein refolding chaperone